MGKNNTIISKSLPFSLVGSSTFGRYAKISLAKTYNMIISDDWMVPYAGHKQVSSISANGEGRGIYASSRFDHMVAAVNDSVYIVDNYLNQTKIGNLNTYSGPVYIAENNNAQIALCDTASIYVFNYENNTFTQAPLDFLPGYISFHNTYLLSPNLSGSSWRISDNNDAMTWPDINIGGFQAKADIPLAVVPVPGKGNLILVIGSVVTQMWYNTPSQLFPYQLNSFTNIDFGCANAATIATNEEFVVWLGVNEKSGPVIMYCAGNEVNQISTDGINYLFEQLKSPEDSFAFMFKQDGHTIYQLTFPKDNLTIIYDFTTKKFFNLCDEYSNAHIARHVAYFNGEYYFVSHTDGNLYQFGSQLTTYNGVTIPRIRTTDTVRLPDSSRFIINKLTFPIEQGNDSTLQVIDASLSVDGGTTFGNEVRYELNNQGFRKNIIEFRDYGLANEFIFQYKFYGQGRFVIGNGELTYYQ